MHSIRKFLGLSGADRRLLLQAFARLLLASARLRLHSAAWLRAFLQPEDLPASRHASLDPQRIAWAVDIAGRYVPGCTCLVSAIVAQRMMARLGYPAAVRLGVARDCESPLKAHAWLESNGQVLLGGATREQYHTLSPARK